MPSETHRVKRVLAAIGVAAGLGAGAAGIAAAASDTTSPSTSSSAESQQHERSYTSSVQLPEQANQNEADETAALTAAAKITPDQARQAALAAVPGTAVSVSLDNENGNVVYSITITANGTTTDVKVDAGNAAILAKDTPDNESNNTAEASSATEAPDTPEK
jgi:uncharacterized membrane protein YkoI